jgi:sortase (surface protein transpeptidase)
MSSNWHETLNQHFSATQELLLGVSLWQKKNVSNLRHGLEKARGRKNRLFLKLSLTLIAFLGIAGALVLVLPNLYYSVVPADTIEIKPEVIGSPIGGAFQANLQTKVETQVLPDQDETLPEGDWVIIPEIGVKTNISASENADEALKNGVWLSPEYGKPGDAGLPIILAAHRFGWSSWWQSDYGMLNSFYYLPDTKPGTIVEIISDKRKWQYEIFAGEEGEEITRYDADLILYTCKHLSSPIRHIRYARLIEAPVSQI